MRRIFRDHAELFAECTGIPLVVIKNTWTLYLAGSSRLPVNPDKFEKLADETLRLYRKAIPWFPINVSFHRMRRHWPEIMRLLPPTISMGMLSEVKRKKNRIFWMFLKLKIYTLLHISIGTPNFWLEVMVIIKIESNL